jgi:transposase
MSLQAAPAAPVPDETARIAHAAFPRGNAWIQMRDAVGPLYDDAGFAPLFAKRGRPAEAPWRLALVTVMQFAEGLSDRQAAEAVRARIDWKYALGLELTDPGFDFSVLSEFRARLVHGSAEHTLLERLLEALTAPPAPEELAHLPAVDLLRRVWSAEFTVVEGRLRLRDSKELPAATVQVESPYEPEARYGTKRGLHWVGYKAHLTETCDDALPHLLTHVETTVAPASDIHQLAAIHEDLAQSALLPAQHLVDAGYVRARNLLDAREQYQVEVIGPIPADHQWQAQAKTGFDVSQFAVDWDARVVTCPRGRRSVRWSETHTARGLTMTRVEFAAADCTACPARPQCTRAKTPFRSLMLQPREEHQAIQAARQRQQTAEYATTYAQRAGVEGTLSQGVRAFGLRQARYRGLAKTHLQHVATAAAINAGRLVNWLNEVPRAATRCSRFAALAATG